MTSVANIDALGNRTEFVYNRIGELLEQTDPMGRKTRFVYDNLGRCTKTILPAPAPGKGNSVQKVVYDLQGRVVEQIDPLGHATKFEYDSLGRRTAIVDANGGKTSFAFNDDDTLRSITDPVGNVTLYEHDDQGRLVAETNELGKSRHFEYLYGNIMSKKIDRNGREIAFEYDDFGRRTSEKWLENGKAVKIFSYNYNEDGQLTSVDDGASRFEYERDEDGREAETTVSFSGLEKAISQRAGYDILGRREHAEILIDGNTEVVNNYSYMPTGQVASISHSENRVDYSYDASGMRTMAALTSNNQTVFNVANEYDGMGRLAAITQKHGDLTLAKYGYDWDAANRITAMTFGDDDAKYDYDATNQLTAATYDKLPNESYDYDANGNRKNFVTGVNNLLTSDGEFAYTYDGEGNRIAKVSKDLRTEYEWDHRNRLVKVVADNKMVEYVYDYLNRLTKRTEDIQSEAKSSNFKQSDSKRSEEFFVHDAWQIVAVLDADGTVKERNFWGANQDELISTCDLTAKSDTAREDYSAGNDLFPLCDHLGTVRDLADADGNVRNHLEYNSFGKLHSSVDSKNRPRFRYTAKPFDDTTGLQWNINRWYDANVGRWMSEDPIGFEAQDANLYRTVFNNLMIFVDQLGMATYHLKRIHGKAEEAEESDNLKPYLRVYVSVLSKILSVYATALYSTSYEARASKDITMSCDADTGVMTYHGCGIGSVRDDFYVAARVDTSCSYDSNTKILTIIAGGAAAYTSKSGSIGISVTVFGVGGGFSYGFTGSSKKIGETWDYQYQCKCNS